MRQIHRVAAAAAVVGLLGWAPGTWAQQSAALSGTVSDSTGAVIAGSETPILGGDTRLNQLTGATYESSLRNSA